MSFVDRLFVVDVGSWLKVTKDFVSYHLFHCYLSTSSKYRLKNLATWCLKKSVDISWYHPYPRPARPKDWKVVDIQCRQAGPSC